jgi:hypothetical protein
MGDNNSSPGGPSTIKDQSTIAKTIGGTIA